jgi:hypothetical protein
MTRYLHRMAIRFRLNRIRRVAVGTLTGQFILLAGALPCASEERVAAHHLTDFSNCVPQSALSEQRKEDRWRLVPYKTAELSGTLIYAPSFSDAPNVTLPLNTDGWHRIRVGIWQPSFAYDGTVALKLKLSGEPAFRRINPPASADTQKNTYIREVYFQDADLTGQDLVVGKMKGLIGRGCALAYVRLEPISPLEVDAIKADRSQDDTRNLVSVIDGVSYFHYGEYSAPRDVLDQVELYRYSDVAKVLWAVNYGDRTNFPTEVPGAVFLGTHNRSAGENDPAPNDYVRGEQQAHRALRDFAKAGAVPHVLAAKHAQDMNIEFDLMFRLGILGDLGFVDLGDGGFFKMYPHCRQVLADGTVVDKASYAFTETQDFTIALMREALSQVDADGINLCFVRGPHMIQYEKPVLEAFQAKFGEDARNVPPDDPRLEKVRADFVTDYVSKVHALLQEIGASRGRPINLSVWVWPSTRGVWLGGTPIAEGLDVKHWIQQGWLDSVICQEGIDPEFMALGKKNDCDFVLFTGYRGDTAMSPASVTRAYGEGVEKFAYWDMDAVQIMPAPWNWLQRIGHRDEMANWDAHNPKDQLIPLTSVAGINVARGLVDAVYSGG